MAYRIRHAPGSGEDYRRYEHLPRGPTRHFRPPTSYTGALKRQQLAAYGYADVDPSHYEEDYLIPLGIGRRRCRPKEPLA